MFPLQILQPQQSVFIKTSPRIIQIGQKEVKQLTNDQALQLFLLLRKLTPINHQKDHKIEKTLISQIVRKDISTLKINKE
jgi:hypothetical protein